MDRTKSAPSTVAGYVNQNGQVNLGKTDPPRPGNDYGQFVYIMRCPQCERNYGVNGSDIFQRKCPFHQGGLPGSELQKDEVEFKPGDTSEPKGSKK